MTTNNGNAASHLAQLQHAEALLCSLAGVITASIRQGPHGGVGAVHVTASDEFAPRQVARNVQSALLAQLGVLIDHRAIAVTPAPSVAAAPGEASGTAAINAPPATFPSPAQSHFDAPATALLSASYVGQAPYSAPAPFAGFQPQGVAYSEAVRTDRIPAQPASGAPSTPRPRLDTLELERIHPHRVRCRIGLTLGDMLLTGEAETLDSADAGPEVAARASIAALLKDPGINLRPFELDGLQRVELSGRQYIVAAVRTFRGRVIQYFAGISLVEESAEDAAALATLQAVTNCLGSS